jgi:putative redox protein
MDDRPHAQHVTVIDPTRSRADRSPADRSDTGRTGTGRTVHLERTRSLAFRATNDRGGVIEMGNGSNADFSPVELLLAAVAGCTAMDVDAITGKRAEPQQFEVEAHGRKVRDDEGNHLTDVRVTFRVRFDDDEGGRAADSVLPTAVQRSHDRLCTVSRTVELPTPVEVVIETRRAHTRHAQ